MSAPVLSSTLIFVLALPLCLSNLTLSVLADEQPPTALDWRLHLNVDKFTDEKTLIASTEYPLGGHTIKITFSCVEHELGLPLGRGLGDPLALDHWPLPVYIEVSRHNSAANDSCKDVGFLKSGFERPEYRIDDGDISHVTDASRYCNMAKLVLAAGFDASVPDIADFVNEEYSEIRLARRLRIRIKDQTDANFDLDINMTTPVIQQFVAQCPVLSVKPLGPVPGPRQPGGASTGVTPELRSQIDAAKAKLPKDGKPYWLGPELWVADPDGTFHKRDPKNWRKEIAQ